MVLPMIFMQFGIFRDYWGDFRDNAWSVHIHYWTGTVWYLYLVIQPWFFFGVAAVEIVMMTAFGFAIIKSIIQRKQIENHAWWLISTVFIIMMPALGRGIQNVYVGLHSKEWPHINIMLPIYITQAVIISMLLLGAWKYKKLKHPATYLAVGVNLFIFLLEPLGRSENVQLFLKAVIKG